MRTQLMSITRLPVPPSSNQIYAFYNGRMIKTKVYKQYETEVVRWVSKNPDQVKRVREFLKQIDGFVIHIESIFWMPKKTIVCINGKPKRNDTSNRIKALHDALSSIVLGVDDSYFWSGKFDKMVLLTDVKADGYVNINLRLRKMNELMGEL